MIQVPRRSVTRFFIPLIDVMVLLFCIFLLMPALPALPTTLPPEGPDTDRTTPPPEPSPGAPPTASAEELARQLREARAQAEQLRREKDELLQRLTVRTLEIDGQTGRLYYYGPERQEIANQAQAEALLDRDRREFRSGGRELYYLFLYPRGPSSFPTQGQVDTYQRWFASVPHGFDNPTARR